MKEINLKTTYHPHALVLQIEPTKGGFVEASLITQAHVAGHEFRHDLWWRDIPNEVRERAQELIDCAIDMILHETVIHDVSKSAFEAEQAKTQESRHTDSHTH